METREIFEKLAKGLKCTATSSNLRVTLFIANCDRHGNDLPVDQFKEWVESAAEVLTIICGGVTTYPEALAKYEVAEDRTITEKTVVLYGLIFDETRFSQDLDLLADFIHAYGESTNQKEVMLDICGDTRKIEFSETENQRSKI